MTEDQANVTRCCGPQGCGGNSSGGEERFCSASRCMGWRFLPQRAIVKSKFADRSPFEVSDPQSYEDVPASWEVERLPAEGFCGLAGSPR